MDWWDETCGMLAGVVAFLLVVAFVVLKPVNRDWMKQEMDGPMRPVVAETPSYTFDGSMPLGTESVTVGYTTGCDIICGPGISVTDVNSGPTLVVTPGWHPGGLRMQPR